MKYVSETSKTRYIFEPYCKGAGLDLGFGGDKIVPNAISLDLPIPYADTGYDMVQLSGDARDLYWFKDNVLDYVYSSHLLEDFEEVEPVLKEWLRVIKKGGYILLNLPNEKIYREICAKNGQPYNTQHKHEDMSLEYMRPILDKLKVKIIKGIELVSEYCFIIVGVKQ